MSKNNKITVSVIVAVLVLAISVSLCSFAVSSSLKKGDINGDGEIDVCDCVSLLLYFNSEKNLSDAQLDRADVNSDGRVNDKDLYALADYVIGDGEEFDDNYHTPTIDF